MIDLGDVVTLTYPSKPASPSSVTVTIGLPDGTSTAPVSATTGTYLYTPTQVGRHSVLWVATGPSDSYSDVFDVSPGDAGSLISLADAKAHLRVTQSSNDEELRLFLAAATALIEHEVGPVLQASHTEVVLASDTIVLAKAPVIAVTSLASLFPTYDYTFNAAQYVLDGPAGILRRIPFIGGPLDWSTNWTGLSPLSSVRLTVTYTAGRPTVPAALQTAARIIVENLWESRRLAGPRPAQAGDESQPYDREIIPSRAVELMAPYRRAPLVV